MLWLRGTALVILLVLAGLPVGGMMCAVLCAVPSTAADSHHGTEECEGAAHSSPGPQIDGVSKHDCRSHEASIGQSAVTTPERAHAIAKSGLPAIETMQSEFSILQGVRGTLDETPPGSAPPTTRPSVLRI